MIRFDAPDRPLIAPVSGKYDYQENIIVTVPDGCTVYYAFDETPTIESTQYTDPVPMPQGEHTFSAIAVDSRGKVSPVASEVYVYYGKNIVADCTKFITLIRKWIEFLCGLSYTYI